MQPVYTIEAEGLELGVAVRDAGTFRFYAARAGLSGLERLRFVSLHDVERAVVRAHACRDAKARPRPRAELSRGAALLRWRGLPAALARNGEGAA